MLGLEMLRYDIAVYDGVIGCISQSMINPDKERLIEGVNYLVGYDNMYDPSAKEHHQLYSYQYISDALSYFKLDYLITHIEEIIVFDALIGNGDRHQENWGVIAGHAHIPVKVNDIQLHQSEPFIKSKLKEVYNLFRKLKYDYNDSGTLDAFVNLTTNRTRFSPIYDSGSSLAREHDDQKIKTLLKDSVQFDAYINRGKSEIHWKGNKLKHFELVEELLKVSTKARDTINLFSSRFNEEEIVKIIYQLDKKVPEQFNDFKLSEQRKEFLTKLITSRYKKLVNL